ncbi:MAG: ribbon-helix-helix domain-containing protein [Rhodoglobus sp.]
MTYLTVNGVRIEGVTVAGKPVDDAQIQEWADEAERGYDISKLKLRGRPSMGDEPAKVTTLRLEPRLDAALSARAQREGSSRSEVIRAALRAWLESASPQ